MAPPRSTAASIGCDSMPQDHDALYKRGTDLINPYLILVDRPAAKDAERTARLNAGIACLDRALTLAPTNWAALWLRGKAFQSLADHAKAHDSFRSAFELQPKNPDVGRELAAECMELGKFAEAVTVTEQMTKLSPQDAGLQANLALALLLDGQVQRAQATIAAARRLAPEDPISKAVEDRINQVADGKRPRPKSLRDLEK